MSCALFKTVLVASETRFSNFIDSKEARSTEYRSLSIQSSSCSFKCWLSQKLVLSKMADPVFVQFFSAAQIQLP